MASRPIVALTANSSWYLYNYKAHLCTLLTSHGYKVVLVAPEDEYSERLSQWDYEVRIISSIERGIKRPLRELQYLRELREVWKVILPDCVISHTTKANIYTQLSVAARTSTILVVNGLGDGFSRKGLLSLFLSSLYKVSFKRADRVIFQNQSDRKRFLEDRIIRDSQSGLIEGSGIDTEHYRPIQKGDDAIIKFIYVGRLLRSKGVMMLQEAFMKCNHLPIRLQIVGGLDMGNATSITSQELELLKSTECIEVLGHRSDVKDLLSENDVFIFPTYYNEGLPRAILEAMAVGLPVITTTVAGCRDVIEHGVDGLLLEPQSQEELDGALMQYVRLTPDQRRAMGVAARDKAVKKYDIRIVDGAYLTMVKELIQ